MSMPGQTHFKLESVSSVCDSVYSDLKAIDKKLRKILQENNMATEGKRKKEEGASANIGATGKDETFILHVFKAIQPYL